MQGLSIILFIAAIAIILINFMINLGNITKISMYCIQTNTLNQYWSAWFKSSVNGRAIISSIIGFVLAVLVFFLIMPIVLIQKFLFNKKVKTQVDNGLWFDYSQVKISPNEGDTFFTNINKLGLEQEEFKVYGDVKIDVMMIVGALVKACQEKGIPLAYKVMEEVKLHNTQKARVPVLLEMNNEQYPVYLIYNDDQKNQFYKVGSQLEQSGFKDCFYFSVNRF
ncbi:MAG: hypothetical protein AB8H03_17910 [Saprospiraceae bacterium]